MSIILVKHDRDVARLCAMLRRQHGLLTLSAPLDSLAALSMAIVQGACRGLQELLVDAEDDDQEVFFRYLAAAIQASDTLPKLEAIHIKGSRSGKRLDYLLKALASGAAPSLRRFYYDYPDLDVGEVEDLVGMVEARRSDCQSISALDWKWLAGAEYQTQLNQLLPIVLPSAAVGCRRQSNCQLCCGMPDVKGTSCRFHHQI